MSVLTSDSMYWIVLFCLIRISISFQEKHFVLDFQSLNGTDRSSKDEIQDALCQINFGVKIISLQIQGNDCNVSIHMISWWTDDQRDLFCYVANSCNGKTQCLVNLRQFTCKKSLHNITKLKVSYDCLPIAPNDSNVFDLGLRFEKEIVHPEVTPHYLVLYRRNYSQSITCSLVVEPEAELKVLHMAPHTSLVFNLSSHTSYHSEEVSDKCIRYFVDGVQIVHKVTIKATKIDGLIWLQLNKTKSFNLTCDHSDIQTTPSPTIYTTTLPESSIATKSTTATKPTESSKVTTSTQSTIATASTPSSTTTTSTQSSSPIATTSTQLNITTISTPTTIATTSTQSSITTTPLQSTTATTSIEKDISTETTTATKTTEPQEASSQTTIVAIAATAGLLTLAILVMCVLCFYRRWSAPFKRLRDPRDSRVKFRHRQQHYKCYMEYDIIDASENNDTSSTDKFVSVSGNFSALGDEDYSVIEDDLLHYSTPSDQGPTNPGPSDLGPTNPGPSDLGPTNPGPSDLGPTNPGPSNLGPTNPGPSDLGPTNPGPSNLGPTNPGPSNLGPTNPGPSDLGPTNPGPSNLGPTNPGPSDLGPTNPGPSDLGPTNPGPSNLGPTNPGPSDLGPTNPGPTDSRPTLPGPIAPRRTVLAPAGNVYSAEEKVEKQGSVLIKIDGREVSYSQCTVASPELKDKNNSSSEEETTSDLYTELTKDEDYSHLEHTNPGRALTEHVYDG
ncbi:mucin-2-like isoform X2 [Physella acuta]|uniref:mucin-2-like isoform X2 n=1 Tax=Physella acuta TaxID=109671 RepID=UPI0027DE885A|nr:mucin-2-like isoform X2 [Physella acuta]